MERQPKYESPRQRLERERERRVEIFDRFIDLALEQAMDFDIAVGAYKDCLEYEQIPLTPAVSLVNSKL